MSVDIQPPAGPSDPEVIARVLAGDIDAYEAIVRRHEGSLYRHARGMGLDHDTSLDVVQDALVKAYLRLADCRDPARFRAWLFRITRNLCFDHLRMARQVAIPLSNAPEAEAVADETPGGLERSMIRQALERLTPVLREAFLLKHEAGYSYEEIAEITGAGPSAVKMRVHRARIELCEYFAEPPSRRAAGPSGDQSSAPPVYHMKAMNHEPVIQHWSPAQPRRLE